MDRCLPQVLLYKNPYTGTDTLILLTFFVLCVSQVILLDCDVEALGGVYCYAFLSVMCIFAFGNMILKVKRPSLPRTYQSSWLASIAGFLSVAVALLGNVLGKPEVRRRLLGTTLLFTVYGILTVIALSSQLLTYFFVYFMVIGTSILLMFKRVNILRICLFVLKELGVEDDLGELEAESGSEQAFSVVASSTRSPRWWWKRGAATATHESKPDSESGEADPEAATLLQNPYRHKAATRKSLFRAIVGRFTTSKTSPSSSLPSTTTCTSSTRPSYTCRRTSKPPSSSSCTARRTHETPSP